jgi:hypothetical protein
MVKPCEKYESTNNSVPYLWQETNPLFCLPLTLSSLEVGSENRERDHYAFITIWTWKSVISEGWDSNSVVDWG